MEDHSDAIRQLERAKELIDQGLDNIIMPGGQTVSVRVWNIIDALILELSPEVPVREAQVRVGIPDRYVSPVPTSNAQLYLTSDQLKQYRESSDRSAKDSDREYRLRQMAELGILALLAACVSLAAIGFINSRP